MDFLTLTAGNYIFYIGLLVASCVALAVYKDWVIITPALVFQYFVVAVVANDQNGTAQRVMLGSIPLAVFLKTMSGVIAALIIFLTGYAIIIERRRLKQQEAEEDAAGTGGLRRFFRRQQKEQLSRFRYIDYMLPIGTSIIAAVATYAFATLLPFSGNFLGDFAFYWTFSIGVTIMVVGSDILKLGIGLLTALNGADLLYSLLRSGDNPLVLGFSAAITILLALLISYLAILFYNKLKTLNLSDAFTAGRKAVK
ncbi:MAG: hypothetical protein HXX08_04800 [Chloroflexi bacterium]|uniref:Uncharacterized protein n=1 Tax=Candidatus Chlorohelix allophototropha TaxID=3003348 RepID=A0A8T7M101_9CHLR|nr:hypothetical protein [Chloroflexota bacterium]WJW67060.1 hypothetical protein OZ401_000308 [Chloroflexota bacterium L227-S17]